MSKPVDPYELDWNSLGRRATGYAVALARRYGWDPHNFPNGESAQTVAQEAAKRILSGERRVPDTVPFDKALLNIVRSMMRHTLEQIRAVKGGLSGVELRDVVPSWRVE